MVASTQSPGDAFVRLKNVGKSFRSEGAMLEVVDPAFRDGPIVGTVEACRDRPDVRGGVVIARCRRTRDVALGGPDGDVGAAHVRLGLTQLRALPGHDRRGRGGG